MSIIAKLFTEQLKKYVMNRNVLVFGSGTSGLHSLVYGNLNPSFMTVYDFDKLKVKRLWDFSKYGYASGKDNVLYTSKSPLEKYDVVVSLATFHEKPFQIIAEKENFINRGGVIGVIDYDMKGLKWDDFYMRWGCELGERKELDYLGFFETHLKHTLVGLEDCVSISEKFGFETLFSRGKLESVRRSKYGLPTTHFIYIGKKN